MFRILVAEDDHAIRTLITTKLKQENYTIYTAENGEEALSVMEKHQVDLLISDIMMPVMDGYSLVNALRETKHTLPILMITAKSQLESLEEAFTLGVDDYMDKPIRTRRVGFACSSIAEKSAVGNRESLTFSTYETRLTTRLTLTDLETDTVYQIPKKEFYVLYKLLSNPEKIFTRLDLLDDIWGMEEDLDERLVDACIKRVRQKFKDNPDFDIVTIRGLGYKGTVKNG